MPYGCAAFVQLKNGLFDFDLVFASTLRTKAEKRMCFHDRLEHWGTLSNLPRRFYREGEARQAARGGSGQSRGPPAFPGLSTLAETPP